uniref:Uncharacterized protein n=1 Tax=Kalanchoe fedtschenkoi TaxID=63787 RepID=A0A7N0UFH1_KALFE
MGEIDTKPIESVQAALCYFGEKNEQRKLRSPTIHVDVDSHKDLDELRKELANYKVQLEAKRSEHMQSQLNLEHYQETVRELSAKLDDCEAERDACMSRLTESGSLVEKLEIEMKQMADQLSEALRVKEQLSHVYSELKAAQTELISMAAEFASERESKVEALTRVKLMEGDALTEKERTRELLERVSELDEASRLAKLAAAETEVRSAALLTEKDDEIQSAKSQQLEAMRSQTETVRELEHQLLSKSLFIDALQAELQHARELSSCSEEAAAEAVEALGQLKTKLEAEERKTAEQLRRMEALNMEQGLLRMELKNSVEDAMLLNRRVEKLTEELESAKEELAKLKAGGSKIAAADASEAESETTTLKLRQEADESLLSAPENNFPFQAVGGSVSDYMVTISLEEYQSLSARAEEADLAAAHPPHDESATSDSEIRTELQVLKKEHEAAMAKVNELRTRAEQAASRAESAERAKLAVEARYQPLGKVLNMKF